VADPEGITADVDAHAMNLDAPGVAPQLGEFPAPDMRDRKEQFAPGEQEPVIAGLAAHVGADVDPVKHRHQAAGQGTGIAQLGGQLPDRAEMAMDDIERGFPGQPDRPEKKPEGGGVTSIASDIKTAQQNASVPPAMAQEQPSGPGDPAGTGGRKGGIANTGQKAIPLDVGMNAGFRTGGDGQDRHLVPEVHQSGDLIENERLAQGRELVHEDGDAQPPGHGVPLARAQVT